MGGLATNGSFAGNSIDGKDRFFQYGRRGLNISTINSAIINKIF